MISNSPIPTSQPPSQSQSQLLHISGPVANLRGTLRGISEQDLRELTGIWSREQDYIKREQLENERERILAQLSTLGTLHRQLDAKLAAVEREITALEAGVKTGAAQHATPTERGGR